MKEQALNCPRCNSTNTKFCYYNNYSLTQPRYFCKTCRRYWTEGGSLRNVPVGGGSRKNKRSSSAVPPPVISSKKVFPDLSQPDFSPRNPKIGDGHDLNLAYDPSSSSHYNAMSEFVALHQSMGNPNSGTQNLPLMELLKSGGGLSSFMSSVPISDAAAAGFSSSTSAFPSQDFKPSLGFSVDGIENGFGNMQESTNQSSRILFPFEELKQPAASNNDQFENWSGMLAGGSW